MIDIGTYDLPDAELLQEGSGSGAMTAWVPERLVAVIGCGSDPARELNLAAVKAEMVPVIRRPTGGCSVILSPNMYAISFVLRGRNQMKSCSYFNAFGELLVEALKTLGLKNLHKAGTSDIVLGDRKIAGSALYRTKEMVFHHAVINISERPSTINRLLAVPPREPRYRSGRSHSEFVTSLRDNGYSLEFADFREVAENIFCRSPLSQLSGPPGS